MPIENISTLATVPAAPSITEDIQQIADALFNENVLATMAPNTARAYNKNWHEFTAWTAAAGVSALPASPDVLIVYIRHLQDSGKKYASICQAIAAIKKAHQIKKHPSPMSEGVKMALKAAARKIGTAPKQKDAMTIEVLSTLIRSIQNTDDSIKGKRDAAILSIGFMGAFRRSELSSLKVNDLEYKTGKDGRPMLIVNVRRSKTDQTGSGMYKAIFSSSGAVNAVKIVMAWIMAAGIKDDDALFPSITKGGRIQGTAIRGADIARMIKTRAAAAGIILDLSGHSMRRGFVTSAINAGASERSIMNQTGHKSVTTMRRYFERHAVENDNAASMF